MTQIIKQDFNILNLEPNFDIIKVLNHLLIVKYEAIMFDANYKFSVVDRFLKYVKIDTQSKEDSSTFPSDPKQLELSKILVEELKELGLNDSHMDENGYVMATLPSNTGKDVDVIGFIAHVDTSPAVSGKDVKPQIHKNYQGGIS